MRRRDFVKLLAVAPIVGLPLPKAKPDEVPGMATWDEVDGLEELLARYGRVIQIAYVPGRIEVTLKNDQEYTLVWIREPWRHPHIGDILNPVMYAKFKDPVDRHMARLQVQKKYDLWWGKSVVCGVGDGRLIEARTIQKTTIEDTLRYKLGLG